MPTINVHKKTLDELKARADRGGIQKIVVGAVIVREGKVLLLRRTPGDFMEGLVELPSGTVDLGENLMETLIREVQEETGLTTTSVDKYVGSFDYLSGSGKKTRQFSFLVKTEGEVKISHEHNAYFWVTPNDLKDTPLPVSEETKKTINGAL